METRMAFVCHPKFGHLTFCPSNMSLLKSSRFGSLILKKDGASIDLPDSLKGFMELDIRL